MKTVNIFVALDKSSPTKIPLGRQGENKATKIVFDCNVYAESFGAGTAYLFHQRAPDTCPYPVAIEQDGNTIKWEVSASDTEFAGQGQCELFWYVDDIIAKTQVWSTTVTEALTGTESEEVPEAAQGWVSKVLQAIADIGKVNDEVVKAAVAAYIAENGLPDTGGVGFTSWSYDTDTGYIHLYNEDGEEAIEPLYAPGLGFADLTEDELQQVNTILTRASNYAAQAGQAKEVASASAENATKSAQDAATSAERATQSASAAATSETNASQSASSAAADADLAKQYNDSALKAAGEAAQSLSGAQDAAETAQEAAQEAIAARDGFKVDTTLSQSGQAADAKAVGDALSSLSEDIANLTGGMDLSKLVMTVSAVEGGNRLTLSDGTSEKSVTIPAVAATAEDIEAAVNAYLSENPVIVSTENEPTYADLPKVFITGDITGMSKNDAKDVELDYFSKTDQFHAYINMKWQGTSSINFDKKNFTIKLYSDEAQSTKLKKDFYGWGEQYKFCLKANFVDITHSRNIVSARLWSQIVASRADADKAVFMSAAPNFGAIDGFPFKMYINGKYEGLYTWNIPKDAWMFGMDDSDPNNCVLCAEQNNNGNNSLALGCEFRAACNLDGGDWSVEVPDATTDAVKTGFNALVNFIMTATDEEFIANLGNYANVQSLIDYFCFMIVINGNDSAAKNMLMVTENGGGLWYASMYDMDSTWGQDQQQQDSATSVYPTDFHETNSLLWERMIACFADKIKERYFSLRADILSTANIFYQFEHFSDQISTELYKKDQTVYTLPGTAWNSIDYIESWVVSRLAYTDSYMETLGEETTYYTVSNNLTNAASSNSAATVAEGESYSATITANSGYTLTNITVSMGGVDVTAEAVSGNQINIAAVTGNLVISASTAAQNAVTLNLTGSNFSAYSSDANGATGAELSNGQSLNVATYLYIKLVPNTGYVMSSATCTGGTVNKITDKTSYYFVEVGALTSGTDVAIAVETVEDTFDDDGDMYSLASTITSDGTNGTGVNTGVLTNSGAPDVTLIVDFQLAAAAAYGKVLLSSASNDTDGINLAYGNNYLSLKMQYGYDILTIPVSDLARHKIGIVFDRTNAIVRIYADGELVRTVNNAGEINWLGDNENPLCLLGHYHASTGTASCVNGSIYHCDVYSRVLSTAEVIGKMNSWG